MVRIRLARRGRKFSPFYHLVVADSRSSRDGKFIEKLGKYDPVVSPLTSTLMRKEFSIGMAWVRSYLIKLRFSSNGLRSLSKGFKLLWLLKLVLPKPSSVP